MKIPRMMHGFSHSNPLLVILAYFQFNLTPNLHFILFFGEDAYFTNVAHLAFQKNINECSRWVCLYISDK